MNILPSDVLFESVDPHEVIRSLDNDPILDPIVQDEKNKKKRRLKKGLLYGGLAAASLTGGAAGRSFATKLAPKYASMSMIANHPNAAMITGSSVPKLGLAGTYTYSKLKKHKPDEEDNDTK